MALKLRPVEWVVGGYAMIVIPVAIARSAVWPDLGWVALAHLLILVLLGLLTRAGPGRLGELLRDGAPLVLLLALYGALDALNGHGARPTHDPTIQAVEQALFGGQPSRDWWRASPSGLWSTVFHAAYSAYYVVVPLPLVLATWKRDLAARRQATFAILTAFLACYLWFVFYPVAGPYYEFPRPDGAFVANPAARLVYGVLGQASSYGAAFPSSHVAGTWAAVASVSIATWRWPLALIACTLTVGVVYCQMHYAVDAIAGLLVAAGAMLASRAFAKAEAG